MEDKLFRDFLELKLHHSILLNGKIGDGQFETLLNLADRILMRNVYAKENMISLFEEKKIQGISKVVMERRHPDLLIIENDSSGKEIGVDVVKETIMDFIPLTPTLSDNKVLIVNSIDEMNRNSQNAMLKILEEPQKNTYIFLVCNNINNVITTIKSRCLILHTPKLEYMDWRKNVIDGDVELYNLSGASVYYANLILDNDGLEILKDMQRLLSDKILNIEQLHLLADKICKNSKKTKKTNSDNDDDDNSDIGNSEHKFDLFCNFIMLILYNSLKYYTTNNVSTELMKFVKLNNEKMLLNKISKIKEIIKNTKLLNLNKKHSIIVCYIELFK